MTIFFSHVDAKNCCLRAGYSRYLVTHSFSWCARSECPDNARMNQVGALLSHVGNGQSFEPSCPVDLFMSKLVSSVLSHVMRIRAVLDEDEHGYGMGNVTCERFLGLDWQATFIRKFCVPVVHVSDAQADLICLEPGMVNPPQVQYYQQSFTPTVTLFNELQDLDLSQVLPRRAVFTLDDLRHTVQ